MFETPLFIVILVSLILAISSVTIIVSKDWELSYPILFINGLTWMLILYAILAGIYGMLNGSYKIV